VEHKISKFGGSVNYDVKFIFYNFVLNDYIFSANLCADIFFSYTGRSQ